MEILPLADRQEFVAELSELHHKEWKHLSPSLTLQQRTARITELAGRAGIPSIFIAVSGSQLIGSAALVSKDMEIKADLSPWLAAVYVKEQFRRQGAARKLVTRCEEEARRAKVDAIYLYTEFATTLYYELGWYHMDRCEYRGVVVDVMSKQLFA